MVGWGSWEGWKGRMRSPFQGQGGLVERWKGRASWAAGGTSDSVNKARTEARCESRGKAGVKIADDRWWAAGTATQAQSSWI